MILRQHMAEGKAACSTYSNELFFGGPVFSMRSGCKALVSRGHA